MKYFAITAATLLICGVAGLSTQDGAMAEENINMPEEVETLNKEVVPVEYIDFDPYYITAELGKNEG